MSETIIKFLKRSKDNKPKGSMDDANSEVTIIEGRPYYTVGQTTKQTQQTFNPADMCFGSCCRK
ncbi:hypothetical protein BDV59DRAFT_200162 [Aspergillus ambiguus]|uniref:uncharacterized protein n=1 Tax=Aspergillus ambiguus TaxID=176160 RepID=UPI003CCD6DEA